MADKEFNNSSEEEILDIDETEVSEESMFSHKLRNKDKKIKNSDTYNNSTIIYVISMVALFVIWFTAFAQPLAYNNRLLLFSNKNKKDASNNNNNKNTTPNDNNNNNSSQSRGSRPSNNQRWNVGFINNVLVEKVGEAYEVSAPTYTSTRATFHVGFIEQGDEITYNIDIKNSGTIDAKVSEIIVNPISEDDDPILYSISNINVGDELDAGKVTTMSVRIQYNPNYTGPKNKLTQDLVVLINYVQK